MLSTAQMQTKATVASEKNNNPVSPVTTSNSAPESKE